MRSQVALLCALICVAPAARPGSSAVISVVGELTKDMKLQPGGRVEGKILIRSNVDNDQEVRIYQTDYMFHADGTNVYGEPGSVKRSDSSWIQFTSTQFVIPPKQTFTVSYTVQVPQDDKLTGTYWSMLMVEPVSNLPPPTPDPDKPTVMVRTVIRFGMQFVVNIGDTGKRSVRFLKKELILKEDKRILEVDIENNGERLLNPLVWVELYDATGVSIGRFEAGKTRMYPGCSVRFGMDLSDVPKGSYDALVVADNEDEYVFGSRHKVSIE